MTKSLITIDSLSKRYSSLTALENCSLRVQPGEVFGLLGPNGSGKTTLLRLLMGFLNPTAGSARIGEFDCHTESLAVRRLVSYLPGEARLFRRLRGRDVLRFFGNVRTDADYGRAVRLADRLELDLSRKVATSSTGMRQKLALAAVLSVDAPLFILDEPTSNLDPSARHQVLSLVREARDEGRSVLFSSHVLSEIEDVCDRVAVLRRGHLAHIQLMSLLRRRHRLRAKLKGQTVMPPEELNISQLQIDEDGLLQFETPNELAPLFGWLAQLRLEEVQVEPVGLKAVYDRYHGDSGQSPVDYEKVSEAEEQSQPATMVSEADARTSETPSDTDETRRHAPAVENRAVNRALCLRTMADARGLVLACAAVLFVFHSLSVWMISLFDLPQLAPFIQGFLPEWMQAILPLPIEAMGTHGGMLALSHTDPVVLFTLTIYAIARGSDVVSGPLDRGTMEMVLAQPLGRLTFFLTHTIVTCAGVLIICIWGWLGICVGLSLVEYPTPIHATTFLPATLNLMSFTIFLSALTSLFSSCHRYRWQTISWVGGVYIVQLILKIVSRAHEDLNFLAYLTFFGSFEPAVLGSGVGDVIELSLRYDGTLIGLGILAFFGASSVFCRRDLPAPL